MAIFFMNRLSKGVFVRDEEGYDYPDLEYMRAEAILAAREHMAAEILKGSAPGQEDRFDITDAHGVLLLRFFFIDALDGKPTPHPPPRPSWMEESWQQGESSRTGARDGSGERDDQ